MRARRARAALTVAGIALGVGILFAALATNASIDRSVDRTVLEAIGRADLRIAAFQETGLSVATLTVVRNTPGVAQATGQIERRTYLQAALGSGPRPPVTLLAVDPSLDRVVHDRQGFADLASDGEVLVSEDLAREDGLAVGSTIVVQGAAADVRLTVRGVLSGNGPILDGDGRAALVTLQAARAAFGPIGLSRIDLTVGPGVTPAAVTQELERRLGLEPYLLFPPAGCVRAVAGLPGEAVEVPVAGVVLEIAMGVLVPVAAALEPAWRAGRTSPIEALRSRPEQGPAIRARLRWLAVVFAAIAVAGLL